MGETNIPNIQCLSNHGLVLVALSNDPQIRIRDLAERIGLTERAVQRLVTQLVEGGLVARERQGRRNRYRVLFSKPLDDPLPQESTVADLVGALANPPSPPIAA